MEKIPCLLMGPETLSCEGVCSRGLLSGFKTIQIKLSADLILYKSVAYFEVYSEFQKSFNRQKSLEMEEVWGCKYF